MNKKVKVKALDDISFTIKEGSTIAIVGPSGSGKSTMLNILGGLDTEYKGSLLVDGKDIKDYDTNYYRRNIVGTIFQQFNLVSSLTVAENILLPITFGKQLGKGRVNDRLEYLLGKLGLKERADHKPTELSGGQSQRVAIARALIAKPKIILADEPTGNLDSKTGGEIVDLLFELNKEEGTTLIIVTHDPELFNNVDRKIHLRDGKIIQE
ncbi:ABC transporter ATP-binding protein [Candidatus Dojkabacteria bacterium]|nr:ABC transporter ATP-binding protein [Candidatus Dojkabacteria bacterium]